MKRLIVIVLLLGILCALFGCSEGEYDTTYHQQSVQNEEATSSLIARQKMPQITRSSDWQNISDRIEYLNDGNAVGYLYLLTEMGQLVREVQVRDKVTSLNSYITPMEEVRLIKSRGTGSTYVDQFVLQAPDLDGTYGENARGVFWFTSDGVYQEYNGLYFFSAERLSLTTTPILIDAKGE